MVWVRAPRRGLYDVTREVARVVEKSGVDVGLCNVFIRHTSASLCIQENADPTARQDLEEFFDKLVPEDTPWFRHTHEGPDDMPSHIKSALTAVSLDVPVRNGRLALGTWQGIYLWEHRDDPGRREIVVTVREL
ncbi:MAG TPA: secondary thiamine-phosphate synthase enzyme YjbQ [Planctomycetota bacterium]|nr:secondary thiamine-phosphate synthase enzyme YjbQ [Planctomycetota bacterium]